MTRDIPTYQGSSLYKTEYFGVGSFSNPGPNPILSYCYKLSDENERKRLVEICRDEAKESLREEIEILNKAIQHPLAIPYTLETAKGTWIDYYKKMLEEDNFGDCASNKFHKKALAFYKNWLVSKGFNQIPEYDVEYANEKAEARIIGYAASESYCIHFKAKKFTVFE